MMRHTLRGLVPALCLACSATSAVAADTATIRQTGTAGTANIDQVGNIGNAIATITQGGGANNLAHIAQSGIGQSDLAAAASATIDQAGSDNVGRIDTTGLDLQDINIVQAGNGNLASIAAQTGKAGAASLQTGNGNLADLSFNVSESGLGVTQTGNGNYARMNLGDGGFISVSATMTGDFNSANMDVSGVFGTVTTTQNGHDNAVNVLQQTDPASPFGNTIEITQNTSFNLANVSQIGAGFTATVVQDTGNGNTASVNQHF